MPEPASKPAREPTLEASIAGTARAIALCRLAFFILVTFVAFGSVLLGADDGGSLLAWSILVGAVFPGSFLAGLAGFAFAAGAGSHSSGPIEKPLLRRVALAFRLVSGGARILA